MCWVHQARQVLGKRKAPDSCGPSMSGISHRSCHSESATATSGRSVDKAQVSTCNAPGTLTFPFASFMHQQMLYLSLLHTFVRELAS